MPATPTGTSGSWAEHAAERLTGAGYRRGGARAAVIECLAADGCARSALEVEEDLRRRERSVGRASVYRVLDELAGLGLLRRVDVGDGVARFERDDLDHHHHHLVCDRCGQVVPFSDDRLEAAIEGLADRADFAVSAHEVTLRGACAVCVRA